MAKPTKEQENKYNELVKRGYKPDTILSIYIGAGVVYNDGCEDMWFFGPDGSIHHNLSIPEAQELQRAIWLPCIIKEREERDTKEESDKLRDSVDSLFKELNIRLSDL